MLLETFKSENSINTLYTETMHRSELANTVLGRVLHELGIYDVL